MNTEAMKQHVTSCLAQPSGEPVPLAGVVIEGVVYGAEARVTLRQRYVNTERGPIEAIYTFPAPSDATVVGFAMKTAGKTLEAEVEEREKAFEKYDEAVSAGHGAALLDEERKNVFTASVGNLLPGEETVIEITYVQKLSGEEGSLRLMVPTLVAPRYMPGAPQGDRTGHGAADPTDRVPDADRISPKVGHVAYGVALDLVFDVGAAVAVTSPSHAVTTRDEGTGKVRVSFAAHEVALDRDVVLVASGAAGDVAGLVATRDAQVGEPGAFALTVVPDLFDPTRRSGGRDVVFVVDVSGSMSGDPLNQAKAALRLCLRHLREGDRFEVLPFSDGVYPFFGALTPFTQATLSAADAKVAALDTVGGTEMLGPLARVRDLAAREGREFVCVLLTDGQVGNEAEIVGQVCTKGSRVRFYTFGIGLAVSDLLVRELAKRSGGAAEFIYPGERFDEKVIAQFAKATAERVRDVKVTFTGVEASELAPSEPGDLVDGEPWVLYGRYEKPGLGRAQLRGTRADGEAFFLEIPVELPVDGARPGLDAMWAATRIRELEAGEAELDTRRKASLKARVIELAKRHRVSSKFTSFVVIDKREGARRTSTTAKARPVPVHAVARGGAVMPAPPMQGFGTGIPAPPPYPPAGAMRIPPPPAPRMAAMAPMPMPMPARSAPAAKGGGLFEKAKKAAASMFRRDESDGAASAEGAYAPDLDDMDEDVSTMIPSPAPTPRARVPVHSMPEPEPTDPMQALFAKQLASGLWQRDGSPESTLEATATALAECAAEGITTSHAVYGVPVKKAVAALLALVAQLAARPDLEAKLAMALTAAYLVSSGPKLRTSVVAVVKSSSLDGVRGLAAELVGDERAKAKLALLRGA